MSIGTAWGVPVHVRLFFILVNIYLM